MTDISQRDTDPGGSRSDNVEIDFENPSNNRSTDPLYRERPNKTTNDSPRDGQTSDRIKSTEPDVSRDGHYTLGGKLLEDRVSSANELLLNSKYITELGLLNSIDNSIRCLDEVNQSSQSIISLTFNKWADENLVKKNQDWFDATITTLKLSLLVEPAAEFLITQKVSKASLFAGGVGILISFNDIRHAYNEAENIITKENNARYERCMAPLEIENKRKGIRIRSNNTIP